MRCRRVQKQLESYLAAEQSALTAANCKQIEAHLKGCSACRHELSRLGALRQLLATMPVPPVPEGLARRVVARAKALQRERAPRRLATVRPAANVRCHLRLATRTATALAVGIAVGAFLANDVWRNRSSRQPASETRQADSLGETGLGRLMADHDHSLAQAYLELTSGHDG